MAGFDRIKPPERRLLDRDQSREPLSGEADHAGRAGLFSVSEQPSTPGAGVPPRTDPGGRPGRRPAGASRARHPDVEPPPAGEDAARPDGAPVSEADPRLPSGRSVLQVQCSHCGITCPMPLTTAIKRALPLALAVPGRSHPVFATCPCGERRTWLRPSLSMPR